MTNYNYEADELPPFKTPLNYHLFPQKNEVFTQPSQTIPDQSLSIKQVLLRYAQGLPITGQKGDPVYEGDDPMPDLSKMDLAEKQILIEFVKEKRDRLKLKLEKDAEDQRAKNDEELADFRKKFAQQQQQKLKEVNSKINEQIPADL